MDDVKSEWRKLHNKELNDLYCTPNIVRVLKSNKSEMGETCSANGEDYWRIKGFWWGNVRERDHLGDPGLDGRIILRWNFRKWYGEGVWTGSSWLRIGTVGGHLRMR
jgi:hypothetical protein